MARYGFIHDKLDIKMLELYLLDRAAGPLSPDTLAELTMHHEGVEYFDFAEATAELVETGHLLMSEEGYVITEKGRENSAACESSLPFSVRRRCDEDLQAVNNLLRRNAQVRGEKTEAADGTVKVKLALDDEGGNLMTLELFCPTAEQAERFITAFKAQPEQVYKEVLETLMKEREVQV